MARPKRFELLTPRFVVWCSIQLSYGRACRLGGELEAEREVLIGLKRRHPYMGHSGLASRRSEFLSRYPKLLHNP